MIAWLVIGSAACVWDDLSRWPVTDETPVVAVNHMILDAPGNLIAGATLHPEMAAQWACRGVPIYAPSAGKGPEIEAPHCQDWYGTSGLFGIEVALWLGAERIVLAGCPIDETPHYYDGATLMPWLEHYRDGWMASLPEIKGRVKSLSGWTREILGEPPSNW